MIRTFQREEKKDFYNRDAKQKLTNITIWLESDINSTR